MWQQSWAMMRQKAAKSCRTVMVVEDDDLTRLALTAGLTAEGYNVIEATDADDARMLLEHGATGIHALITDNCMPGPVDGLKLARQASKNWPWIRLIMTSGLNHVEDSLPEGCLYVQKPYRVQRLVEHLIELA